MKVYVVNSAFHKSIKAFSTKEKAIKFIENFTKIYLKLTDGTNTASLNTRSIHR